MGCQPRTSDQATIQLWREAYQNEFVVRMDWTIKDFAHANHNLLVNVNGKAGTAPLFVEASLAGVELAGANTATGTIKSTATCRTAWLFLGIACPASGTAHVFWPSLTTVCRS